MITLKGIELGSVFTASGTLNFFGQGWPHHKIYRMIPGFNFRNSTFIAKTTTLDKNIGNMPLDENFQPKELFPDCVKVYFSKGLVLNSVGLSGPGAKTLLETKMWQNRISPFFISFMAIRKTAQERTKETEEFADLLKKERSYFIGKIGLEVNFSCPNVDHDPQILIKEALEILKILRTELTWTPLTAKINALVGTDTVKRIASSGFCDAISISNTIPWLQLQEKIDWINLFRTTTSPLAVYGGGGMSGWPLVDIVKDKIKDFREAGIKIPIIAGGGLGCRKEWKKDIVDFKKSGANAVSIGSVSIIRPYRIKEMIDFANWIFRR